MRSAIAPHGILGEKVKKFGKVEKKSDLVELGPFSTLGLLGSCSEGKFDQIWPNLTFSDFFRVFPQTDLGADFRRVRLFRVGNPKRVDVSSVISPTARVTGRSR